MAGAAAGGAELFFERLCLAMAAAGDTVLPVIRREPARAARLAAGGLKPVELAYGGRLDLLTRPRIAALLRRFAPDLALAWMSRAAFHAAPGPWPLVGRLGGYYSLKYYRHCDHLVGNTHGIVDWIAAQGWPRARVHYLPNFVADLACARPADRADLGVPEEAPLLLGLGRLHQAKGFDLLIRAMATLPQAHLVIAGVGPERAALQSLTAQPPVAGRVHLLGWRTDVGALLRAADLFVCSSRHEPLGNIVLEAFSAGTPVLAAASPGPRELIRDGEDGVLVAVEDEAALARAAASLLADAPRRASLAAAGRERYCAEFAPAPVLAAWRQTLAALKKP